MKCSYFITFFFLIFTNVYALDFDIFTKVDQAQSATANKLTGGPEKVEEVLKFIEEAKKVKPIAFDEMTVGSSACSHCPKHVKLTGDINKILAEMKKDPKLTEEDEVPISINRLNFMYYQVKSIEENGTISCSRYQDHNIDLKPTKLDGEMELMAENVFKFEGASAVQLMDPKKEEITYYYRGEGDQKNIIVQAVLTKNGGKFRYYYYRPTEKEKNPYGLPSLGEADPKDSTVRQPKVKPVIPALDNQASKTSTVKTPEDKIAERNKLSLDIDPTLETRLKFIPKNVHVAKGEVSQNFGGTEGVRIAGKSNFSLKGNEAVVDIAGEDGYQYVKVDLKTSLNGSTTRTITVPYEVRLGDKDDKEAMNIKGSVVDTNDNSVVTLSLTDSVTTYVRTEFKRDRITNVNSFAVAKDFSIAKDEMATVAVGSNETKDKYVSFQHRKAIKDNITMVLDVRFDENKKASLMYQVKMKF